MVKQLKLKTHRNLQITLLPHSVMVDLNMKIFDYMLLHYLIYEVINILIN